MCFFPCNHRQRMYNLRLIGWKKGNDRNRIDAPAGYQDAYYWQGGKYQGPDEYEVEPVYEAVV